MIAEEAAKGHYSGVRRIFHVTLVFMTVIINRLRPGPAFLAPMAWSKWASSAIAGSFRLWPSQRRPWACRSSPAVSAAISGPAAHGADGTVPDGRPVCPGLHHARLAGFSCRRVWRWAAAGAAFGAVPRATAGLVLIAFLYYRHSRHPMPDDDGVFVIQSPRRIIRRLIVLAVPVAAANMLLPAVASIDLFIVPLRLEAAGYSTHQATALYGYLTGMANGLVQLPAILTIALATSLVPAVSAAFSQRNRDVILDRTDTAMRIANVITVPACRHSRRPYPFPGSSMRRRQRGRPSASCPFRSSSSVSSRSPAAFCRAWAIRPSRCTTWPPRPSSRLSSAGTLTAIPGWAKSAPPGRPMPIWPSLRRSIFTLPVNTLPTASSGATSGNSFWPAPPWPARPGSSPRLRPPRQRRGHHRRHHGRSPGLPHHRPRRLPGPHGRRYRKNPVVGKKVSRRIHL